MANEIDEYVGARRVLAKLSPSEAPKWVWMTLTRRNSGESCWTDEQGVQHWEVWDENGVQEFERKG